MSSFYSLYSHDMARVAVAVPLVKVADPIYNAEETIKMAKIAVDKGAVLILFPELGLSAYSNDDLFQQEALQNEVLNALHKVIRASENMSAVLLVGAPLLYDCSLWNCGIAIHQGKILGISPKTYLPNYREFYERRQFSSGHSATFNEINVLDQKVPFGSDLIFECTNYKNFKFHIEICEDVWTPIPPSTYASLAGATILTNLSASNITIGKAAYRRDLCAAQSGKCISAYMYSAAGPGESSTDLAWDGHALIYELGEKLSESERFTVDEDLIFADIDLGKIAMERSRISSFRDSAMVHKEQIKHFRKISFGLMLPKKDVVLERNIDRFPYVPNDEAKRNQYAFEAYSIQVQGLAQRMKAANINKIVIGISGGLDSTQALLVAAQTMDQLGLPRTNILGYTMPGFATSKGTKSNAWKLMKALRISAEEIDITPSCMQMLKDIKHPFANGEEIFDITFENVQAGERTSHLFRLANHHKAMVLGTGDLSELALGWATYGVGDHMSHYNVNASVPKTLIQYLIRWMKDAEKFGKKTSDVLQSILDTEISPELVPTKDNDAPIQSTQAKIGPYELQDFNTYYTTRYGFKPSKIAFLSYSAWRDKTLGDFPEGMSEADKNEYTIGEIKKWLKKFCWRFFQISQFKRTAVPNGPKVQSGGSLSPRGDWRAPSDASAKVWLKELEENVPES